VLNPFLFLSFLSPYVIPAQAGIQLLFFQQKRKVLRNRMDKKKKTGERLTAQ
jgi:hypothetical protein